MASSPYRGDGWLRFTSPPSLFLILTQSLYNQSLCDWLGFFAFRLFTNASIRHSLKTKKPVTLVTGFVIRIGFEPMTYCLEGSCSIQLSYRPRSFQLEVQNKDNLTLIQRKRALNQSVAIKSLITTLAAVHPNIAGI